jgi:cytoskeleton protein RodZ
MAVVPPAETALSAQSLNESGVIQASSVTSTALTVGLYGESDVSDALNNSSASALDSSVAHSSVSSLAHSVKPSIQGADNQLDSISLTFTDECWVEVSDASGDVLVADLQRVGSNLLLQGQVPFYVKLGNAPAAKIELNGKEIAIVPATDTLVFSGVIE